MAGLFSAVAAVGTVIQAAIATKDSDDAMKEAIKLIKKNNLALSSDGSMTKFLTNFIVEPVIIVSKDAKRSDISEKVFALNSDIFCSFYLQVFNALANIYNVEPRMAINLLSSTPYTFGKAAVDVGLGLYLGKESRKDWVSELESNNAYLNFSISSEASKESADLLDDLLRNTDPDNTIDGLVVANKEQLDFIVKNATVAYSDFLKKHNVNRKATNDKLLLEVAKRKPTNKDAEKGLTEKEFSLVCSSLNVDHTSYKGKYKQGDDVAPKFKKLKVMNRVSADYKNRKVEDMAAENLYGVHHRELTLRVGFTITNEDRTTTTQDITIPITVKTAIIATDINNIINILKPNDRTKSFGYRLDEYRSGSISLKELIFCGDLIDQYKKNKLSDKDGILNIIKQREESSNAKALSNYKTFQQGFEKFYNMLIVTADEKVLLNKHIGGDILIERYKQELLTQAKALTISILDEDYERLYILTKDIRGKSETSYKSLSKKKDNGVSDEMFKALLANRPPII